MKIIVSHLAIEYKDEGTGPVMLMLHGWQDSLQTFDLLAPELVKHWRVVRLDLPGFGASEPPKDTWKLDDYVALVQAFIRKLELDPEVIVGHSLGGRIAIKGVSAGFIRTRKLVLVASAGLAKTQTFRNRIFKLAAKLGKVITLVPPLIFWRQKLRQRLYDRAGSDYLTAGSLKGTFINIINEDLTASARGLSLPTLLIWGEADDQTPIEDAETLHQLIAGSKLQIITGATHFVHQEHPAEVARFIQEFTA